jgi:SAM-dependent methyltransferase
MKSLTHETPDRMALEDIFFECQNISQRLSQDGSIDGPTKERLLTYLNQLTEFELGRFFIKNQGALSGHWTYYIILGFTEAPSLHPLEEAIITTAPSVLATRQRFHIFQSLLQKNIQSNTVTCSVPCGVMADLLTLDLPETVENVRFIGIDLDQASLDLAQDLATSKGKHQSCQFFRENAWDLASNHPAEFDLITTNGLNIYEADDDKVTDLYKALRTALKPGGKLIGSALSLPQEWDMSKIDLNALDLQRAIFIQILQATWSNFRSVNQTTQQLNTAGFDTVEIHWDDAHMFYSFEACIP